jgi:disulfide oxidoreductase YuzD
MIIIGDENIDYEKIEKIDSTSTISSTTPNSTVLYKFNFEILKYTQVNNISSAVITKNLQEVIYASNFKVKYIIVEKNIAKHAQDIANNYMLDSKILVAIETNDEIVENAIDEIDGVIYKNIL